MNEYKIVLSNDEYEMPAIKTVGNNIKIDKEGIKIIITIDNNTPMEIEIECVLDTLKIYENENEIWKY